MDGEPLRIESIAKRSSTSYEETIDCLNCDSEIFAAYKNAHSVNALVLVSDLLCSNAILSLEQEEFLELAWQEPSVRSGS